MKAYLLTKLAGAEHRNICRMKHTLNCCKVQSTAILKLVTACA